MTAPEANQEPVAFLITSGEDCFATNEAAYAQSFADGEREELYTADQLAGAVLRERERLTEKQEPVGRLRMGANQDFYTTKAAGYISDNEWHDLYLHPAPVNQQLLEACEGVAQMARCGQLDAFIGEPWLNAIHAAIAQAEGKV